MTTAGEERTFWESVDPTDLRGNVCGCEDASYGVDIIDRAIDWREGMRALDLGCGPARVTFPLAERYEGVEFVGVDISMAMRYAAPRRGNLRLRSCDGRSIPFAAHDYFDAAFSMLMVQHVPPVAVRGYLAELARVLKTGAPFVVQWVYGESHRDFDHKYACDEIVGWLEVAGFTVQSVEPDATYDEWLWCVAVAS